MEKPALNTNTRILRVSDEGFRTASGVTCNSCGVRDHCSAFASGKAPQICGAFSPLISFLPPLVGFDGWFNTFRLGRMGYERFNRKIGTVMTLYDKRKSRVMGYARLNGVAVGPMEAVLSKYAWSNHLMIGKGVARENSPDALREILIRNYKTMFKTSDMTDPFTVMFMTRCAAPKGLVHDDRRSKEDSVEDIERLLVESAA